MPIPSAAAAYLYSVGQCYHSSTAHTSLDYPLVYGQYHHIFLEVFIHESISMV